MSVKKLPLPTAIIPFILQNLQGFEVSLEDGERIVIVPRANAQVVPGSRPHLAAALNLPVDRPNGRAKADQVQPPPTRVTQRPKFIYRAKNAKYAPDQARAFGLSKPRLLIYTLVHQAGATGIGYAGLREKSKLPHGSVMQILHWLRKQRLITGTPETMK